MHPTIATSNRYLFAVVGSAYVSERHADEMHRYLPPLAKREFVSLNFDRAMNALKTIAVSIRRSHFA